MKGKEKEKDKIPTAVIAAAIACVIALIAVFICLKISNDRQGEFVPPPFDAEAQPGVPEVPQGLGWSEVYQEGMDFRANVCGAFVVRNGLVDIYFTNSSEKEAWLKLCVLDENEIVLGETGIIKNGEHVKNVVLDIVPENGSTITMKIMAYEPETYYSLGAVKLNTIAVVE